MNMEIGKKLKNLRTANDMNIKHLSEISEVSTGLISQAERGLVIPSVENLWKLSKALNVNVSYFFEEYDETRSPIVRKSERRRIYFNEGATVYEQLTPNIDKEMEFYVVTVKANSASAQDFVSHEGVETGVIMTGNLDIIVNGVIHKLNEGDSIYFDSSLPHKYVNSSDIDCISIWAMTPATF